MYTLETEGNWTLSAFFRSTIVHVKYQSKGGQEAMDFLDPKTRRYIFATSVELQGLAV